MSLKYYRDLRDRCTNILSALTALSDQVEGLQGPRSSAGASNALRESEPPYSLSALKALEVRARSELLTVAFFGAFSAGKSFLISALAGRLRHAPRTYQGQKVDRYEPLIPASPRPTSACPLSVEPTDRTDGSDTFMVRFEGITDWKVFHSVDSGTIQAYVTDLPDAVSKRAPPDAKRTVAEARLLRSNSRIPARMYDLPGIGSIGNKHRAVTYSAVERADCIVYVASSERPIAESELDLLRFIYKHHQDTGKRTLFLLTQIDKHRQLDPASNKLIWEDVLAANNAFLGGAFPDKNFIGQGFLAVSAAEEAKGLPSAKRRNPRGARLVAHSQMPTLRRVLLDYLVSTSGPLHLNQVVMETERALTPLLNMLSEQVSAEEMSLDDAEPERRANIEATERLVRGQMELRASFMHSADEAIERAFFTSHPSDLAALMQEQLVPRIKSEDVLRERVIHELELYRFAILKEWVQRQGGLSDMWNETWQTFKATADERVLHLLQSVAAAGTERLQLITKSTREQTVLSTRRTHHGPGPAPPRASQTFRESLNVATNAWALLTTLGAGGLITGASAGMVSLTPVGLAVILTAMLTGWFASWRKAEAKERTRQHMIDELGQFAKENVAAYRDRARNVFKAYIGNLMSYIDEDIRVKNRTIDTLTQRIASPEYGKNKERRMHIRNLHDRALSIRSDIADFHRLASQRLHT